jgi:GT2 family glycosyltransferase
MVSELVFVVGPDLDPLLVELAEALARETGELGLGAAVERGSLPERRPGRVAVVLDPERLRGARLRLPLSRRALKGTLLVHAGTDGRRRRGAQPAFELDLESARARAARGETVTHLPIGWTARWEPPAAGEREIDLAIVGADREPQFRLLAAAAGELSRWRVRVVTGGDPLAPAGPTAATPAQRRAVLARSKVLIDLSPPAAPRVDALRAAEAACTGAVRVDGADAIATGAALLDDADRLNRLRSAALEAAKRAPLRSAAQTLATAAESLREPGPRRPLALARRPAPGEAGPPPVTTDPDASAARRRLKRVRLAEIELGRVLEALAVRLDGGSAEARIEHESAGFADAKPRVSVLVTLFDYEREIEGALESVAASEFESVEAVIVDDASRDGSRERAAAWIDSHPELPARIVAHPANRGLPSARNTALAHARGELAFILDADNRVLPHGLGRLVEALDDDPGAAMAYGLAARVDEEGRALGLMNVGGWEPSRLRFTNYIDAMAMLRTAALRELGGYTTELRLHGWEDYDLWCRMAELGMRAAHVPEILAVYRSSYSGMAWAVSNISTTEAYEALIRRAPRLMSGVQPPR